MRQRDTVKSHTNFIDAESDLTESERRQALELLESYSDIFSSGPEDVGETDFLHHRIHTTTETPTRQRAYRTSPSMRVEIQRQVDDLLERNIIEESHSPWASPIVMVRKKDNTYRFCVDYRALNAITIRDSHPIPRQDDSIDALSASSFFSVIDLSSGYWQVKMHPADKEKTAFTTGSGLYHFNVMPFGKAPIQDDATGRRARWIVEMNAYSFDIQHRRGRSHQNADAMSRRLDGQRNGTKQESVECDAVRKTSKEKVDLNIHPPSTSKTTGTQTVHQPLSLPSSTTGTRTTYIQPTSVKCDETQANNLPDIEKRPHGDLISDLDLLQHQRLDEDISKVMEYVKDGAKLMTITTTRPLEKVFADIAQLPRSRNGYQYLLVVVDHFSKYLNVYAMKDQTAQTVARHIFEDYIQEHGVPESLHTDQGRQFESKLVQELCKNLGIEKTRSSPYHPQGAGLVERANRVLKDQLAKYIADQGGDWDSHLHQLQLAYNSSVHSTTGLSPYFIMHGREARTPANVNFPTPAATSHPTSTPEGYTDSLNKRLSKAFRFVKEHTRRAQVAQQEYYDKRNRTINYSAG
nr:uncharacterized protein LOC129253648 [Lytechinus pictus]